MSAPHHKKIATIYVYPFTQCPCSIEADSTSHHGTHGATASCNHKASKVIEEDPYIECSLIFQQMKY